MQKRCQNLLLWIVGLTSGIFLPHSFLWASTKGPTEINIYLDFSSWLENFTLVGKIEFKNIQTEHLFCLYLSQNLNLELERLAKGFELQTDPLNREQLSFGTMIIEEKNQLKEMSPNLFSLPKGRGKRLLNFNLIC